MFNLLLYNMFFSATIKKTEFRSTLFKFQFGFQSHAPTLWRGSISSRGHRADQCRIWSLELIAGCAFQQEHYTKSYRIVHLPTLTHLKVMEVQMHSNSSIAQKSRVIFYKKGFPTFVNNLIFSGEGGSVSPIPSAWSPTTSLVPFCLFCPFPLIFCISLGYDSAKIRPRSIGSSQGAFV